MSNKKPDEAAPTNSDIPLDAFRLEFSIHIRGAGESPCQFSSHFEIPLGMRQGHLHSTLNACSVLFEHAVQIPTMIGVREFMEGRFKRVRKEPPAEQTEPPVKTDLPNPVEGLYSQQAIDEFLKNYSQTSPEEELPIMPSSLGASTFTPADPKGFIAGPPVRPPSVNNLKKAA